MYRVIIEKKAQKFLNKQPRNQAKRLYNALSGLAINPFPEGYEELKGSTGEYRIRVGNMRILYTVEESIITVIIFAIGYRGDVYKR